AAATVEVGEVAGLEMLPAAIGDARRKHRIEHGAARGREHETPLLRRETAQVLAGAREIRAIATEALRAEVIRYPAARELPKAQGEAVREPRAVTVRGEQAHHEAIAGERGAQHRRRQRRAVRARRSERGRARAEADRRHAYSSLSSTTACAAMPSARPRKPRPSVVVALMLTRCSSTFSSCAICRRMASR